MVEQKQTNSAQSGETEKVSFGFKDVLPGEKTEMVHGVFASVASKYDLMNDLMSLGIHRLWKNAMLDWLNPRPDQTLADIGGGTGDITFKWRARGGGPAQVIDYSPEMIAVGRDRAIDRGILDGITWTVGNAEALPLEDASVDVYTSAFCLRNVARLDRALAEARRVLKPGGRFLCLEFSHLIVPALEDAYDAWSFKVLPALGERVAADRDSYIYLAESIRKFPDQDAFAAMIRDAGLEQVKVRNLSAGIAALHSAWRL